MPRKARQRNAAPKRKPSPNRKKAARMNERHRFVTTWGDPDEIVHTGKGRVTFRHWLECEKERLSTRGESGLEIVPNPNNGKQIALARK